MAIMAIATITFGQTKPKYKYSVILTPADYNRLMDLAHNYKDDQAYNLKLNSEQKVTYIQNIDMYLFNLNKSIKIDSTLIASDSTKINSKSIKK